MALSLDKIQELMRTSLKITVDIFEKMTPITKNEYKLAKQLKIMFCVSLDQFDCDISLLDRFIESDDYKIVLFFRSLYQLNQPENYSKYVFGHFMSSIDHSPYIFDITNSSVSNIWDITSTENDKDSFISAFKKQKKEYLTYSSCIC